MVNSRLEKSKNSVLPGKWLLCLRLLLLALVFGCLVYFMLDWVLRGPLRVICKLCCFGVTVVSSRPLE